jgi:hypothetical protein
MVKFLEKYSFAVILLLTGAVLFVAIPLIFNVGDFVTALFVMAGVTFTILGVFIAIFAGNEPLDPHLVGLLPVQACLNSCRIALEKGISGKANFLPPRITGDYKVMQFNPAFKYHGEMISVRSAFTETEPYGLITVPNSDPLIQYLRTRNALIIPGKAEELVVLLSEIISQVLEFAPRVTTIWESGKVSITLHEYRFIEGCLYANSVSPDCCSRYPCPTCSLCGTLIAECTNRVVTLEQCSWSPSGDITSVFSLN